MLIVTHSFPRAALIGNPSDGFHGKTIAFTFSNFRAEVVLYHSPELEIVPNTRDQSRFDSITALVEDVERYGYYGGVRLLKATVKKFYQYCVQCGITLDNRNFTMRYESDIPHGLGLAGSSAIVTAGIRALMAFFAVDIPKPVLANLVLSVEHDELGITAGLQDRVAQVYEGLVYMNFAEDLMDRQGYGAYSYLDAALLPELYVAFHADLAEGSEIVHDRYRSRYMQKDESLSAAVLRWSELTEEVCARLNEGDKASIGMLLNENYDLRTSVQKVSEGNTSMVKAARSIGASAKFTGSGGAIIGTFEGEEMYKELGKALSLLGVEIIQPKITEPQGAHSGMGRR